MRAQAPRRAPAARPSPGEGSLLAQVIGVLFTAGGVLGLVSLVLPHPDTERVRELVALDVAAFVVGITYLVAGSRIPRWMVHATIAGAGAIVCSAIYFMGVSGGLYTTMFVWIALFTAYFLSARAAILHLAWLMAGYAVALALVDDPTGYSDFTRWALTGIALGVASALTHWLVRRRRAADERNTHFFELAQDMLCTIDSKGCFAEVNPAWRQVLGHSRSYLGSRPSIEFVHPGDRAHTKAEIARLRDGASSVTFENRYRAVDGSWRWLLWNAHLGSDGRLIYARATDITERKLREREQERLIEDLDSQARTDPLTDLPNRRWLDDEIARDMSRAMRTGLPLWAAMLDLDHFKRFNDEHGHLRGDHLLSQAAKAWRRSLRTSDFLARFGGEEFVALLPDCEAAEAVDVVERLRAATPGGQTCSAGLARWDGNEAAGTLISRADAALYAAKQGGRDRIAFADQEDERAAAA